jgi:hypothetical protein
VRQAQCADHWNFRHNTVGPLVFGREKRQVEPRVVRHEHTAAKQLGELQCDVGERGLPSQVDAGASCPGGAPAARACGSSGLCSVR